MRGRFERLVLSRTRQGRVLVSSRFLLNLGSGSHLTFRSTSGWCLVDPANGWWSCGGCAAHAEGDSRGVCTQTRWVEPVRVSKVELSRLTSPRPSPPKIVPSTPVAQPGVHPKPKEAEPNHPKAIPDSKPKPKSAGPKVPVHHESEYDPPTTLTYADR